MKLTEDITKCMDTSVLCWLATSSKEGFPNVSPKEIFAPYEKDKIIVANIASPQTVKNILANENVCISFINILTQKRYQLKGTAEIINSDTPDYTKAFELLKKMTEGLFPFKTITVITIDKTKPIIAPRYTLYPDTTETQQIERAKRSYRLID